MGCGDADVIPQVSAAVAQFQMFRVSHLVPLIRGFRRQKAAESSSVRQETAAGGRFRGFWSHSRPLFPLGFLPFSTESHAPHVRADRHAPQQPGDGWRERELQPISSRHYQPLTLIQKKSLTYGGRSLFKLSPQRCLTGLECGVKSG